MWVRGRAALEECTHFSIAGRSSCGPVVLVVAGHNYSKPEKFGNSSTQQFDF
jgi:hypothetical protein